jgi:hypothetical protein
MTEAQTFQIKLISQRPDHTAARNIYKLSQTCRHQSNLDGLDHFIVGMNSWDSQWLEKNRCNFKGDADAIRSDWEVVGRDLGTAIARWVSKTDAQTRKAFLIALISSAVGDQGSLDGQLDLPLQVPISQND